MTDSSYIDYVSQIIDAYSNPTQAAIIHLLRVYPKLSTSELSEKLNKSKSTVLRHLQTLVDIGTIQEEEIHEGRGRYPTKYYSFVPTNEMELSGSKLRSQNISLSKKQFKGYLRAFQSRYVLIREIMDQSVNYLDRMIEEVDKIDNNEDLLELGKDNLGEVSLGYFPKSIIWGQFWNKDIEATEDEVDEYMKIRLVLPIRRLIETNLDDNWVRDGTLWPYDDVSKS